MAMTPPKYLLLDAVHTLMDLTPDFPGFFQSIARQGGMDPELETVRQVMDEAYVAVTKRQEGRVDFSIDMAKEREFWQAIDSDIFRKLGFAERAGQMAAIAFEAFETGAHFRLYAETVPALERIRETGLPIGIVSNGTLGMAKWMESSPLASLSEFILVSTAVGWEKPGGEIFRMALQRAGVAAGDALFVGDSWGHDMAGAARVGIPHVWVAANDGDRNPDCPRIDSIGRLPALLDSLEAE